MRYEFCEVVDLQAGDVTSFGVVESVSDVDDYENVSVKFKDSEFSVTFYAYRELRLYN